MCVLASTWANDTSLARHVCGHPRVQDLGLVSDLCQQGSQLELRQRLSEGICEQEPNLALGLCAQHRQARPRVLQHRCLGLRQRQIII